MIEQHNPCACRVCNAQRKQLATELGQIRERLNSIADHMAWMIRADQRFSVGDKVELSSKARVGNLLPKTRQDRKGVIKRIENAFSILVQLEGYSIPRSYHHAWFNRVSGPKLF